MIFNGDAFSVTLGTDGIAELKFDLKNESINKFNRDAITELKQAVEAIAASSEVKGVIVTSAKESFVVGADITEFGAMFALSEEEIVSDLLKTHGIFNSLEDLEVPTVTAINGICLGGGFELALATDYRLMAPAAKVGLPEVKLGIFPGFGGTVRLSRLIGADNAIEWICSGSEKRANDALKDGAVDGVVELDGLTAAARQMALRAANGELDFRARKQEKKAELQLNNIEGMMAFETAKGFVAAKAGPHYPAPVTAIKAIQKHASQTRDQAVETEARGFAKVAKTKVAENLIGLFLKDQYLKKTAKKWQAEAADVKKAAVLGAGIMGGGIAYQSASKHIPILMKDINEAGIKLGLDEAAKLTSKQVERGRLKTMDMATILNDIRPTLSYGDFGDVDVVVEAVVENPKIKKSVLAEAEGQIGQDKVLASNTSTISITELSTALKRPENFCGMHFFNPVHRMPLVEVIRGQKTSDQTVATVVAYAQKLGKTPIVVNDCPGFLVNRILFPYFGGFAMLVRDGVDFQRIDKVMEKFGWPMGPAYLMDVVGIDTGVHAQEVMAAGFPDRMAQDFTSAIQVMYEHKRYGQKSSVGFYRYELDKKGKQKKATDPESYELIKPVQTAEVEMTDEDIIARMMIPLCLETVRCLEDGIVSTAAEADMGLVYGIGFPPFRGGALKYIDDMGVAEFLAQAEKFADLGALYQPTAKLAEMAKNNETFF
ncbi:fatty acid oxidation complex subunit alpha FadB [Gynuella sunshinyii]|uniref:enoyl-CoA hydratase n=1 Tax=Gynuella sunshinyii YC6258 TaxID=1445510 RepID=A0A0C5VM24_9GAMM|nr:fatty acid oxidation complex subunit alpha FadB [Gynuella sunshinyii]AJQ95361.1 3-hydroxyacyl-CoA dehydrogenase [Gynuella sunshinyii YC6258]